MSCNRKLICRKIIHDIKILEIPSKKKHFIEYGITAITSSTISFVCLVLMLIYRKNDIASLFSFIGILSMFFTVPFLLMFIFWAPSDISIGKLNDYGVVFQIIEGKCVYAYDFDIDMIKDMRIVKRKRRILIINTKDGKSFVLQNIRNAKKIVKTYYAINEYYSSSIKNL